jgi:hypothetical protein
MFSFIHAKLVFWIAAVPVVSIATLTHHGRIEIEPHLPQVKRK